MQYVVLDFYTSRRYSANVFFDISFKYEKAAKYNLLQAGVHGVMLNVYEKYYEAKNNPIRRHYLTSYQVDNYTKYIK